MIYKSNNSIALGTLLVVIGLLGALESQATIATGFNENFNSTEGWFGANITETVTNGVLDVAMDDISFATAGRSFNSPLSLGVGETLSTKFDIARDAFTAGNLRVYLMKLDNSTSPYYGFYGGFGAAVTSRIGNDSAGVGSAPSFANTYTTGLSSPAVPMMGNGFSTFEFNIHRDDADTLTFSLIQDSTTLATTTQNYNDVDEAAADLITSFNRIYIGWTNTGATPGDSFYLDNASVSVIPEPATLGLVGAMGVLVLTARRFRM